MKVKNLKAGEIFKLKPNAKKAYVMGEMVYWQWKRSYDRQLKKYCCVNFNDGSDCIYLKGDREVYTSVLIFPDELD